MVVPLSAGLSLCPSLYEAHLLLSWTRLKLHDYTAALQQARSGIKFSVLTVL